MGELFMWAGIMTAIILCVVGVIKLPFSKFKVNKPKLYKATFTLLSIILSIAICVLAQLYILNDKILSYNFTVLLLSTIAGVFGLYSSYEGLGLKSLVKNFISKLQEIKEKAPESKFVKYIDKLGINKANELIESEQRKIEEKKQEIAKAEAEEAEVNKEQVETPATEKNF